MIRYTVLEYFSLFSYCPRCQTGEGYISRKYVDAVKNELPVSCNIKVDNEIIKLRNIPASRFVAKVLKMVLEKRREQYPIFAGRLSTIFNKEDVVPVPRSSPLKMTLKTSPLWPSLQIANAIKEELGMGIVEPILIRVKPVRRSSLSKPDERPKPTEHYNSIAINKTRLTKLDPQSSYQILLVDDVVTRGHTFMGSAWRLQDAFPNAEIRAFAAVRTVSNPLEFERIINPTFGHITYRENYNDCLRRP